MLLEVDGQAVRRGRDGGLGVAVALGEIDQEVALAMRVRVGRAGRERLAAVGRSRQLLDVQRDQRQRILGDVAAVRDHHRDRLADVSDLLARQDERRDVRRKHRARKLQRQPVGGETRPQVRERVDRVHAGQRPRRAGVDGADQAVRGRAAQERGFKQAVRAEVVDEAAGAAQQRPVFDARHALADVRAALHSVLLATAAEMGHQRRQAMKLSCPACPGDPSLRKRKIAPLLFGLDGCPGQARA